MLIPQRYSTSPVYDAHTYYPCQKPDRVSKSGHSSVRNLTFVRFLTILALGRNLGIGIPVLVRKSFSSIREGILRVSEQYGVARTL